MITATAVLELRQIKELTLGKSNYIIKALFLTDITVTVIPIWNAKLRPLYS
jgi:hypothetical protein